ncbi:MAG: signal peptidase I [Patescibacteria group bacterium]|nr:signal peptidase I [Patescibacteria group bacterium]MCL5431747.1 signal peptidase I [Patescibacteria group bacterium]
MLETLKNVFGVFWEFIEAIVFALAIFVVVYLFLFQPNQVKGHSMEPTFHDGEYILTDKISYRFGVPARDDIVVFKSPQNQDVDFIKRIIGLAGDTIKISGGKVYLNGKLLDESAYLDPSVYTGPESYLQENQEITVPPGHVFVMGDNRPHSSDSRDFGPVTPDAFIGKVFFRYWPLDRFGKI